MPAKLTAGRNLLIELIDYIQSYYQTYTPSLSLAHIQKSAEAFYHTVNERDDALTANVATVLKEYDAPIVTLIIGGFHTDGITQRLKEKELSFLAPHPYGLQSLDLSETRRLILLG